MCRADAIFHVEQLKNCRAVEIRAVAIRAVDPDSSYSVPSPGRCYVLHQVLRKCFDIFEMDGI